MRYIIVLAAFLCGCDPLPPASTADRDIEIVALQPSPDGSKTAVAYSDSGGGAAGWCYVCADVVLGKFRPEGARCGQAQQWFRCGTDIKLVWQSKNEVVATYDGQPATEAPPVQAAASSPAIPIRFEVAR